MRINWPFAIVFGALAVWAGWLAVQLHNYIEHVAAAIKQ